MYSAWSYGVYLVVSVAMTVWVARTLHKNGRPFLVDAFHGREALADSVNHLLVVGFYLLNFGYATLTLKYGDKPQDLVESIEFLSTKIGAVLVVLGILHFSNLAVFHYMHRHGLRKEALPADDGGRWQPAGTMTEL